MKTLALLLIATALSSCTHLNSGRNPSGADFSAARNSLTTLEGKGPNSFYDEAVQQRAKTYEKRGYTADEARALARAEYLRSGK